jgi:hypothetical protein
MTGNLVDNRFTQIFTNMLFIIGNGLNREEKFKYPHDTTNIKRVFAKNLHRKRRDKLFEPDYVNR